MDCDTILAIVIEQIRTVVPELADRAICAADSLAALGVDSVSRQDVLVLCMEQLGLDLPMVALHGPRNLGELAQRLHSKLPR